MSEPRSAPARALLLLSGVAFLGAALVYNPWTIEHVLSRSTFGIVAAIRRVELVFALLGAVLLGVGLAAPRVPALDRLLSRPTAARLLLLALAVGVPLTLAELALRPLHSRHAPRGTTLFERDAELGWRLRPGAVAQWGGVTARVNEHGLRGPALPLEKDPRAYRILYLGDSVTFGFGIPRDQDTWPYRAEEVLERRIHRPIETLNAGVGGWSPWQQAIFLEREGLRHGPDLVVVGFVLNDVTEKLDLVQFGGDWEGFQVSQIRTRLDALGEASALLFYARRFVARLRFGDDLAAGARRQETLAVRTLAEEPGRDDVQRAWSITLENLARIVETCRRDGIDFALVAFPFTFQLEDPARLGAPQETLAAFARERDLAYLDLLPVLSAEIRRTGQPVEAYFMDEDHLTKLGSWVAGRAVGEWLAGRIATPPR